MCLSARHHGICRQGTLSCSSVAQSCDGWVVRPLPSGRRPLECASFTAPRSRLRSLFHGATATRRRRHWTVEAHALDADLGPGLCLARPFGRLTVSPSPSIKITNKCSTHPPKMLMRRSRCMQVIALVSARTADLVHLSGSFGRLRTRIAAHASSVQCATTTIDFRCRMDWRH